jgi:uncharacterized protein (TIGR03085 family)
MSARGSIGTVSFGARERAGLCDLMDSVGPEHPTLCAGWDTYDLAAHLWVRESDPMAGPGLVISALSDTTERRMAEVRRRWSYPELVDKVRNGPPTFSVFSLPVLGNQLNTLEYFVHHEDVRRAGTGATPRQLPAKDSDELWNRFRIVGRGLMRNAPGGVVFRRPDGTTTTIKSGSPAVTVNGEPSELVLFGYGRGTVAEVELSGDEDAVGALRDTSFGV